MLTYQAKRRGGLEADVWMLRMDAFPNGRHPASIRREHEFEDAFEQFYSLGSGLKEPIQITFLDRFELPEAGIDGGGVTKEFLTSVTDKAFGATDGVPMFVANDQHLLYPNPSAPDEQRALQKADARERTVAQMLQRYDFLGRIIGKCLYEGILVDVNFAPFFLRKWPLTGGAGAAPKESGYRPTLNELRDLDEELYQGLHQLKNYDGDVEEFCLNFTVTDKIGADETVTRELKPGGGEVAVTNQNRLVYISYMARHRLQNQPYHQTSAFLRGLSTMIQPSWLAMFNHAELQTLLSGTSSSLDLADLRAHTEYGGLYYRGTERADHPTIELFWRVLAGLSDGEQRAVLRFVTSTPRAPLLGFAALRPRFCIRDSGHSQDRLPSTSTCVNLLKLPVYLSADVLREKLLCAALSGAGFELS